MRLEVGKFYQTRDLNKVRILGDAGKHGWIADNGHFYMDDGGVIPYSGHVDDILGEWGVPPSGSEACYRV